MRLTPPLPRHPATIQRSLLGVFLAMLLLGVSTSCAPRGTPRPIRSVSGSRAETGERAANDRAMMLWSAPVNYHGVEVRFELPPGFSERKASIGQTESGDRIYSGSLELSYRYRRFETPGGGRHHFEPNSRVFVFRPPSAENPWSTLTDRFSFSWVGNGISPVVREDRRDGSIVWTFRRTKLVLEVDRSITYRHRDIERRFQAPVSIILAEDGTIADERSSLR